MMTVTTEDTEFTEIETNNLPCPIVAFPVILCSL